MKKKLMKKKKIIMKKKKILIRKNPKGNITKNQKNLRNTKEK